MCICVSVGARARGSQSDEIENETGVYEPRQKGGGDGKYEPRSSGLAAKRESARA